MTLMGVLFVVICLSFVVFPHNGPVKDQRISGGKYHLHLHFEVRMGQFDESDEQERVSRPVGLYHAGPLSMKT